jgi:hypothetical protein
MVGSRGTRSRKDQEIDGVDVVVEERQLSNWMRMGENERKEERDRGIRRQ